MNEHTFLTDVTCDAMLPSENAGFHPLEVNERMNGITSVLPSFQAALFSSNKLSETHCISHCSFPKREPTSERHAENILASR